MSESKASQPETPESGTLETDEVLVRALTRADLEALIQIDAAELGRRRPLYFEKMVDANDLELNVVPYDALPLEVDSI